MAAPGAAQRATRHIAPMSGAEVRSTEASAPLAGEVSLAYSIFVYRAAFALAREARSSAVGVPGKFGSSGFRKSQGCTLPVQIFASRTIRAGSSRLATLIPWISGNSAAFAASGDPHSAQKPRYVLCPVVPVLSWNFGSPRMNRTVEIWKTAFTAPPPPVDRWHSLQWQIQLNIGSAEHSYRTAPQAHPPV